MENNFDNQFVNDIAAPPKRPTFLKVLCILTFIWASITILFSLIGGLVCLGINEEQAAEVGEKMTEAYPNMQINVENWAEFFPSIAKVLLITALFNAASLVGAIMMWRLNKIGFFIYSVAELGVYLIGMNTVAQTEGGQGGSIGGLVFKVIIDLAFIGMYAANLKAMNKNASTPQAQ